MDLDDVLEDLLKNARRAVRDRQLPQRARASRGRGGQLARRWVPLAAMIVGLWWVALVGLLTVGAFAFTDGAAEGAIAIAMGLLGLFGVVLAGWGATEARRRRQEQQDARQAKSRAKQAGARAAAMPPEVRGDWRRMEQARELVRDLAEDGWVDPAALAELDTHVAHLQKLLWADHRARELGGRPSEGLARQVADLADLLVALADEAVDAQADVAAGARAPVTLAGARDRMTVLRAARQEVEQADQGGRTRRDGAAAPGPPQGRGEPEPPRGRTSTA